MSHSWLYVGGMGGGDVVRAWSICPGMIMAWRVNHKLSSGRHWYHMIPRLRLSIPVARAQAVELVDCLLLCCIQPHPNTAAGLLLPLSPERW